MSYLSLPKPWVANKFIFPMIAGHHQCHVQQMWLKNLAPEIGIADVLIQLFTGTPDFVIYHLVVSTHSPMLINKSNVAPLFSQFGVIISMPTLVRSFQSRRIFFGVAFTHKGIPLLMYGVLNYFKLFCQSLNRTCIGNFIQYHWLMLRSQHQPVKHQSPIVPVLPEPPCDCLKSTF